MFHLKLSPLNKITRVGSNLGDGWYYLIERNFMMRDPGSRDLSKVYPKTIKNIHDFITTTNFGDNVLPQLDWRSFPLAWQLDLGNTDTLPTRIISYNDLYLGSLSRPEHLRFIASAHKASLYTGPLLLRKKEDGTIWHLKQHREEDTVILSCYFDETLHFSIGPYRPYDERRATKVIREFELFDTVGLNYRTGAPLKFNGELACKHKNGYGFQIWFNSIKKGVSNDNSSTITVNRDNQELHQLELSFVPKYILPSVDGLTVCFVNEHNLQVMDLDF